MHKREYKMPRVKDEIKKAIRLLAAIECHSEVVNETIYLYLTTENFIAKNVKINGRRYRIVKGVAKVPFNRKNWDLILKNKIRVDLELGGRSFTMSIPKKKMQIGAEFFQVDDTMYKIADDGLIQLIGMSEQDSGISISYRPVVVSEEPSKWFLADNNNRKVIEIDNENNDRLKIDRDKLQSLLSEEPLFLFAAAGNVIIPLVSNVSFDHKQQFNIRQERNRVLLVNTDYEYYHVRNENNLNIIEPVGVVPSMISVEMMNAEHGISIAPKEEETEVMLKWINLLNSEEEKIFSEKITAPVKVDLSEFVDKPIAPFERRVMAFSATNGIRCEKGFLMMHGQGITKRHRKSHFICEGSGSRIVTSLSDLIIWESKKCYLEYDEKYAYDFSRCAFRTRLTDVSIDEGVLSFDIRVQSLLSPISSIVFLGQEANHKELTLLKEMLLEQTSTDIKRKVEINLEDSLLGRKIVRKMNVRIGVRYANGYYEEDFVCAEPRGYVSEERELCRYRKNSMVYGAFLGEDSFNLNIYHLPGNDDIENVQQEVLK